MTTTSAPPQPAVAARSGPRRRRRYLPAAAGAAYLAAWAAGLAAWPSNLALNATSTHVTAAYRAHPAGAVAQYLLAEGLAGLLLAVVLGCALLPLAQRRLASRPGARPAAGIAAAAVVISLVQCGLGLVLVAAATSGDVARAGGLAALENRLDGVKMLALAGVAAYLAVTRTRTRTAAGATASAATASAAAARPRPGWLRVIALLAAVALASSAVAYLFLANALAWTVYLSGPLLLLWVAATGTWLTASPTWRTAAADRQAAARRAGETA
ncbi:MAG TPA: hypothetical protein VK599_00150 [Streptosporangiaceae bacterium]|nr:hypothetical protein [Streptosporangiaceae bacterium]